MPLVRDGALDRYGKCVGLAFQIQDDVLDIESNSATLGKTAGKDAAAGKPSYPALFGLDESRALADRGIARARAALVSAGMRPANKADAAGTSGRVRRPTRRPRRGYGGGPART